MQTIKTPWNSRRYVALATIIALLGAASFGYHRYNLPVGEPTITEQLQIASETEIPNITWPLAQASIGTAKDGILLSKPGQIAKPTASAAKLITVLTVLQEKPLALGEPGPTLTIDQSDMALYDSYFRANGSLVAVSLGEQLTQYQMIQGILIRSGNNLADSLAIWAFGSLGAYQQAAQKYVDSLGMKDTVVGTDASGLSPTTISTADDLTRLGIAAMKHEVVREIVRQTSSTFPTDGTKPNTNWMLGQNGVVGIKTGNIPQVGGVFVIASEYQPEGEEPITIVGAVQGASSTYDAITESSQLAETIKPMFARQTLVEKGTAVATITTPWGENSEVVTAEDIATFGWKYAKNPEPVITINSQTPFSEGDTIGTLVIGDHSTDLIATSTVNQPSLKWRLTTSR